jgi:hypothetical protein
MLLSLPLWVDGAAVNPQDMVNLLGFFIDQELTFKNHVGEIAGRGTRAALRRFRAIPQRWPDSLPSLSCSQDPPAQHSSTWTGS